MKEFQSSFQNLSVLLIVAILVIYIVLGVLYESFIHPITILSGLPSAVFGALLTLVLFHKELDLYAFVGIIMLFGVVKKNAIMMVDFAIDARHAGQSARDAIWNGCLLRFRPIMMTTVAALFGTLPDCPGLWRGRGRPPAVGPGGGGRTGGEPVPHAVYHPGDLSLSGQAPGMDGWRREDRGRAGGFYLGCGVGKDGVDRR